jgi:hypothetical protein
VAINRGPLNEGIIKAAVQEFEIPEVTGCDVRMDYYGGQGLMMVMSPRWKTEVAIKSLKQ